MAHSNALQPDQHSTTQNLDGRIQHAGGDVNLPETFETHRDGLYSDAQDSAHVLIHHASAASRQSVGCKGTKAANGKSRTKMMILWVWRFEILALLISCASFAAIVALLATYHEETQPEFAYNININTLIAILSTILRATIVFVIAEVIGQSKWSWMQTPRPARHMEYFHNAGTGAWGSIKIFFIVWRPSVVLLSAFVIVASYAIGPFSQQAATSYACPMTTSEVARLPYTTWVSWIDREADNSLTADLKGTAFNGLLFQSTETSLGHLFQCPSGNCTFESHSGVTHSSIGVCSQCTDVTADLRSSDEGNFTKFYFSPRSGFNLTWPPRDSSIFRMMSDFEPKGFGTRTSVITFKASGCPQNNLSHINENGKTCQQNAFGTGYGRVGRDVQVLAINCTLAPCVRGYNATVDNGVLKETIVSEISSSFLDPKMLQQHNESMFSGFHAMVEPCRVGNSWYDRFNISQAPREDEWIVLIGDFDKTEQSRFEAPKECIRAMFAPMIWGLQAYLAETLAGNCSVSTNYVPDKGEGGFMGHGRTKQQIRMSCGERWWLNYLLDNGRLTLESFANAHGEMATAISNRVRRNINPDDGEISWIEGSAWTTVICIHADWLWLIYPGVLLLLTACLLTVTYVHSCRDRVKQPVWKSAILPLLFYGIQPEEQSQTQEVTNDMTPLLQLKELESLADKTLMRFSTDIYSPGFLRESGNETERGIE